MTLLSPPGPGARTHRFRHGGMSMAVTVMTMTTHETTAHRARADAAMAWCMAE